MPRRGKSRQSKTSSEFNQMGLQSLSWDSLTDASVPEPQVPESSLTSKPAIASPPTPSNSKDMLEQLSRDLRARQEQMMEALIKEAPSRSTTTTPDVGIRLASCGNPSCLLCGTSSNSSSLLSVASLPINFPQTRA